ncbi:unnamed protein product [Blumeria hordei]|uniref:Uncharacterized protein n=1 Tax=Blumeria hordei TaxID=2867405 RepID=A0A383UKM5_BLUHO|nr:unnamed protein product [Blumeria hordei]
MHPNYYYHLKFELYQFNYPWNKIESVGENTKDCETGLWIPPSSSDIFNSVTWPGQDWEHTLPNINAEKIIKHDSPLDAIKKNNKVPGKFYHRNLLHRRDNEERTGTFDAKWNNSPGSKLNPRNTVIDCGPNRAGKIENKAAKIKASESVKINSKTCLQSFDRESTKRRFSLAKKDWRFGLVVIVSIDEGMSSYTKDMDNSVKNETEKHNRIDYERGITNSLSTEDDRVRAVKANLELIQGKDTKVGWGIVHFYREGDETPLSEFKRDDLEVEKKQCTTLCIPAVPSYLTASYFLDWVGEKTREQVSHFRMVMTGELTRYLALMKFRDEKAARLWKEEWDGKLFKNTEPEICHVVFIKSITFNAPPVDISTQSSASFPFSTHDSFTPSSIIKPTASLIELPTCPVCLERMDETSGLLTILCQHMFHCACLLKWKDSSCPVCRHTNSSQKFSQEMPFGSGKASLCSTCDCDDDLWICLICGNVGCGRYKGGHAKEHWKASSHCFALEIETQHVWDYADDVWVHRLIRDKGDSSKIIELPSHTSSNMIDSHRSLSDEDMVPRSKLDVLGIEYTHLLTSQLDSQRNYYEALVNEATSKATSACLAETSATKAASEALAKLRLLEDDYASIQSNLAVQSRDLDREKRKADKSAEMAREFSNSLVEERRVSEGLMKRIEHLNSKLASITLEQEVLKSEICELQSTNHDLLINLSVGEKMRAMEASGEAGLAQGELEAGIVCLPDPRPEEVEKKRRKSRGKGKKK